MTAPRALAEAEQNALLYGRTHARALMDHNHPEHGIVSENWAALNRQVVQMRGLNPDAPTDELVITGGPIGGGQ